MKSLIAITLFASLLFTACGPDDDKQPSGLDSDSIARVELQHWQDSVTRADSLAKAMNDTLSSVPQMDSAQLMETIGILDSIKALKKK
jgi:hypothetical protein